MDEEVIDMKVDQWSLAIKGSRKMWWYTREIGREREREREVGVGGEPGSSFREYQCQSTSGREGYMLVLVIGILEPPKPIYEILLSESEVSEFSEIL